MQAETFSPLADAKAALARGDFAACVAVLLPLLADEPDNADALYLKAVAHRYAGDAVQAHVTLDHLLGIDPTHARAFQERGHLAKAAGDKPAAIDAYERAVASNPGLIASWKALAALASGEAAEDARGHVKWLTSLPPALVSVISFTAEGLLFKAETLCRHFLQTNGHHLEAMRLLAELGTRFQALDEAEFILASCVELAPDFLPARFDYATVLHKRHKYGAARDQAAWLRNRAPGTPHFDMLYANENLALGNFDEAITIYDDLYSASPFNHNVCLTRGHALKTVGRVGDAVASYASAYRAKPDFGDAYWSLANLKTYRFTDTEIGAMITAEAARGTALIDRYHLCFALGKAHEDRGDFAQSFAYYDRGNALKRGELRYDPARIDAEMAAQKAVFTPAFLDEMRSSGAPAPDPIFIVGLPRAGSTLIEQILASHSMVEGTTELPTILALAHKLDTRHVGDGNPQYPAHLAMMTPAEMTAFGEAYVRDTMIYRRGTPYFIDKMPNNFRHIGLIHLILPNAKIIDARRDPMGCCFSGFKQLFAEGQDFSYGLDDIGRYYRGYVDLMAHWDHVLPEKVLRVEYANVVADLGGQVRHMLDYLGLPFEAACLDFHQSGRAVRTPSSEQVRQPIFTSGLDQWENFAAHLDPLRAALGDLSP